MFVPEEYSNTRKTHFSDFFFFIFHVLFIYLFHNPVIMTRLGLVKEDGVLAAVCLQAKQSLFHLILAKYK